MLSRTINKLVGDADRTFSYSTPRSLTIKDWRLGFANLVLKLGIFCYIIIYQVIFQQVYRRDSLLSTSVRTRVIEGDPSFRWAPGTAPYCLGALAPSHPSAALTAQYSVTPTTYTYTGPGGNAAISYPRRQCTYLDEGDAVPLVESDRSFLLTEARVTPQRWSTAPCAGPAASCAPCATNLLTTPGCSWLPDYSPTNATVTNRTYVPDIEFFTLNIDHSFVAPQAGITRNAVNMSGRLIDTNGRTLDACAGYTTLGLACPGIVGVGRTGRPDIVPLRTLLLAAGVQSLDQRSDSLASPDSTLRQQGLVLMLDISYTNYAIGDIPPPPGGSGEPLGGTGLTHVFDEQEVQYTYRVFTVPAAQFQFQTSSHDQPALGEDPATAAAVRYFRRNYGVRLLITMEGRVGSFVFQTLLVNLVAGLALLGLSSAVLEFVALSVCPLRGLYRQLKDRDTGSISQLRRAGRERPEEYRALIGCVH